MIRFVHGNAATLGILHEKMGRFRYEVFVDEEKWSLPRADHSRRIEFDQFDAADATYVVAVSGDGNIRGCARLLPITQPNLLKDVFPELMAHDMGCAPECIWEMSRLGVRPGEHDGNSQLALKLVSYALDLARAMGAKLVVGVIGLAMERFYRRHGFAIRRIGSTLRLPDGTITAIAVDPDPLLRHTEAWAPSSMHSETHV